MKIIFLDFDGVINTRQWDNTGEKCGFSYPSNDKLSDFQSICWLNELWRKTGAKIVLTTSWRKYKSLKHLKDILYNSGVNRKIEIIGYTPYDPQLYKERHEEIEAYLSFSQSENIESFVILDDKKILGKLEKYHVKCNCEYGFRLPEMLKALDILNN